jgi:hypothetical protein
VVKKRAVEEDWTPRGVIMVTLTPAETVDTVHGGIVEWILEGVVDSAMREAKVWDMLLEEGGPTVVIIEMCEI